MRNASDQDEVQCQECDEPLVEGVYGGPVCLRCERWPGEPDDYVPCRRAVILPTHTCFDDALEFLAERLRMTPALARAGDEVIALVHGILLMPEGPREGEPFAHAWVEEAGEAWNSGLLEGQRIYYAVPRDEWLREMRLQNCTRYSAMAAWRENERSGHYGPWVDEYRQLCGLARAPA